MKKFSRWMPPSRSRDSDLGALINALFHAVAWPPMLVAYFAGRRHDNHLKSVASARSGEDIGSFARAFDRRNEPFDPWVVRATWDALEPYVAFPGGRVAIRPTDRFEEDLGIDPDDVDLELLEKVAARSCHSLRKIERNPYYGRLETVGDFVRFITCQPLVGRRSAANGASSR